VIAQGDSTVALLTASGLKDPASTARALPEEMATPLDLDSGKRLLASQEF